MKTTALCALLLTLLHASAWAAPWIATTSGYWTNAATWGGGGTPGAGDDATINNGITVTQDTSSPALNTCTIDGTLILLGTNTALSSVNVTVNGTVTHNVNTATAAPWAPDNRVWIICTNLFVSAGGVIHGDARGYASGDAGHRNGYGPGGGTDFGGDRGGAGGYGGTGGQGDRPGQAIGGPTYGSATAPDFPGSGGGLGNGGVGRGGGLIRIAASDRVTINGAIRANGQDSTGGAGSGSGGGVHITCRILAGTNGTVAANGGNGFVNYSGGGGGGRVAVLYDTSAQTTWNLTAKPTVAFSANQGTMQDNFESYVRPGTLFFPDTSILCSDRMQGGVYMGLTSWTTNTLSISNGLAVFTDTAITVSSNLTIAAGGGGIELTNSTLNVGGAVTLTGVRKTRSCIYGKSPTAATVTGGLTLNGAALVFHGYPASLSTLSIGGDCIVTNGGLFYVYGKATNGSPSAYGAKVTVGGELRITSNDSWILPASDPYDGGSPLFAVKNLAITHTNAGFDANGRGYSVGDGIHNAGYGPGGGTHSGARGGGGGYGGIGGSGSEGSSTVPAGGPTYASMEHPTSPGSGGGIGNGGYGTGAGLIWITASGSALLDGTMKANGNDSNGGAGGGSGGGIYLTCRKLQGSAARLTADGGNGFDIYSVSGGGGRIAIWRSTDNATTQTWTLSVQPGTENTALGTPGGTGTVFFGWVPLSGTIIEVR